MPQGSTPKQMRFGAQIVPPLDGHGFERVACGLVDGKPVALTCGGAVGLSRGVRMWDMDDHWEFGSPVASADSADCVAFAVLEGRPVAVLGVSQGIEVWDLGERRLISRARAPIGCGGGICDVACTVLNGRPVAVTGGYERSLRIWDLAAGTLIGEPLPGHADVIRSVACGMMHGLPIAVTGSDDCTVRVWDLGSGVQIGPPLVGHTDGIRAVAYGILDGRPIVVSGSRDRTVRIWDLDDPGPPRPPLIGHTYRVDAVALAAVAGRAVVVSGGGEVRVWDPRTRRQLGPALFDGRDLSHISSLACGTLRGRPVALAVVGSERGQRVRVWDLAEHRRIGARPPARHAAELPTSWTDPATGDVYDLTRELVDAEGGRWELLDYDGIEPIVGEHPLNPRVTLGIADAHAEYGFADVVTPGPRRPEPEPGQHSTHRHYLEYRIADGDRVLSAERVAELASRYPEAVVGPRRLVRDFDPEDDEYSDVYEYDDGFADEDEDEDFPKFELRYTDEVADRLLADEDEDELLSSDFDVRLEFHACGERELKLSLPITRLGLEAVTPYVSDGLDGLSARVRGDRLFLCFRHYEADGELTHWLEEPDTWLEPLLPLWADLARGDLSAAYLGWLKAAQEARDRDALRPPPRPATLSETSPQLESLAELLHLEEWAMGHLTDSDADPDTGL
jgi:WD domain, G-beta repeat